MNIRINNPLPSFTCEIQSVAISAIPNHENQSRSHYVRVWKSDGDFSCRMYPTTFANAPNLPQSSTDPDEYPSWMESGRRDPCGIYKNSHFWTGIPSFCGVQKMTGVYSTINERHAHNHRFTRFLYPNHIYTPSQLSEEQILSPSGSLRFRWSENKFCWVR